MKKIFICWLLLIVCGVVFAQQIIFNKEAELKRFVERGGKYEETAPNIYKLTYRTGETRVFNLNPAPKVNNLTEGVDTTIINVWEIDTLLYYQKFFYWQKVNTVNGYEDRVFVDDINKNGKLELYGLTKVNWPLGGQVDILEQDSQGIFLTVFSYDSTSLSVYGIGDVDSDGNKEIHLHTTDTINGKFYRTDSLGTLPTNLDFIFYYSTIFQINDITFGDFDNNSKTDCAFIDWPTILISEFNDSLNNFNQIYNFSVQSNDVPAGFAIGDFDSDKKTELVVGTALQNVYVIEAENNNQYTITWQGLAPTYNAYMLTCTNDIDGNGKPEFWLGGRDFGDGISKFMCYEANGDNSYMPVAYIELRYLVSLYANYLQAADMDNDGKEELIINLGNHLLILKFVGSSNYHNYKLYYVKINEGTQVGVEFLPATIHDFNKDGKKDILQAMTKYIAPRQFVFSYLLVQNPTSSIGVIDPVVKKDFDIEQNYPNPFNSNSQIKFIINSSSSVIIKVYNSLGKEIRTLLDSNLSAGQYTIEWDGKDSMENTQASGVYFIRMEANGFHKTIKTILLK